MFYLNTPGRRYQACYWSIIEDSWKRDNITFGTWNTRTLKAAGKLEELTHEMDRYTWNINGLCKTRKSVPRSSRQSDHTRRKLKWYGHVSRSSCLAKAILQGTVRGGRRQGRPPPPPTTITKEEERKDIGGKTTSGNGEAWSLASPRGQWRTGINGENWLRNHLWCPDDPRGEGIGDDDDDL